MLNCVGDNTDGPKGFVKLLGNTYPVRDRLKAMGGICRKEGANWVWCVPVAKEEEAKRVLFPFQFTKKKN